MDKAQVVGPASSISPLSTTLEGPARRRMVVRAVTASAVGTTIEWYDFFLYGVAAATVFPQMFFPQSDPFIGTLLSFSTYFVGFVARPMGAALFGHYGDRVGRKALLVITMMMMGVATVGIGLVPSYATIGIWGAVALTVLRLIQGLSIGGEWSGSVLMAGEWTDPKRRGFTTSFAQFGAPAGMVLANGALALMTVTTTEDQFLSWGWRIPFLASIVLVFVGMYIRLGILETPVFANLKAKGAVAKAPVIEVLRKNWREVALTALLRTGQQVPFYIFTTYIITYATQQLGYSRSTILNFVIIQSLISTGTIPLMGHLSDRYGRRTITAIGCVAMMVFPFVYFAMLDSRSLILAFLAIAIALPIHDLQYGPQAAFISESFPGSLRYSGSSLGYQLASITAGGPAPIIAVILLRQYGTSMAIAVYMSLCALASLICVFMLRDRAGSLDHH
ncbi:MAG TPA: MFS transporter [Vicinamibacterales bacterium]